jgi:carbonic anhydrase
MGTLDTLIEGYRRFRETGWARERERWSELAEGQSPRVMVIACSDSRVRPRFSIPDPAVCSS